MSTNGSTSKPQTTPEQQAAAVTVGVFLLGGLNWWLARTALRSVTGRDIGWRQAYAFLTLASVAGYQARSGARSVEKVYEKIDAAKARLQ